MHSKAVLIFSDLYCTPTRTIEKFKNAIYENKINHRNINVRLMDKWLQGDDILLKIQIINCRATFNISLRNVLGDYNFIQFCEPRSLIEIGYLSKVEEFKRIYNFDKKKQIKHSIINFIIKKLIKIKPKENNINPSDFNYVFVDIQINDNLKSIKLHINKSNNVFTVPIEDLLLDSCLLYNIYPPDLLRIGYQLCNIDIQNESQPMYTF